MQYAPPEIIHAIAYDADVLSCADVVALASTCRYLHSALLGNPYSCTLARARARPTALAALGWFDALAVALARGWLDAHEWDGLAHDVMAAAAVEGVEPGSLARNPGWSRAVALVAAAHWSALAAAVLQHTAAHGPSPEALVAAAALLALPNDGVAGPDGRTRLRLGVLAAVTHKDMGDWDAMRAVYAALKSSLSLPDVFVPMSEDIMAARAGGNLDEALALALEFQAAVEAAAQAGTPWATPERLASVHTTLGLVHRARGDHRLAVQEYHVAHEICDTLSGPLNNMALSLAFLGQLDQALDALEDALLTDRVHHGRFSFLALYNHGNVMRMDPDRAHEGATQCELALTLSEKESDDPAKFAQTLLAFADAHFWLGQPKLGRRLLARVTAINDAEVSEWRRPGLQREIDQIQLRYPDLARNADDAPVASTAPGAPPS